MAHPSATLPRQSSKARDPRTFELSARADGSFGALSSDGVSVYSVRQVRGLWSCTCRGFAARERCCHAAAAAHARTCDWCDTTSASVRTWRNGSDAGAEISLCTACFNPQGVK
jgi:hypothetical protein